jgi:pectin methylesterase-like acyl-CoA thioesterase
VKILSIATTLCLFLSVTLSTEAAGKKKKTPTPAPVTDTSDKITAVHLASIAINVYATHAAKEYKVTPATKITVNGQPAQLNGLATGMHVVVAPAADGVTAATIDAKTPKR